MKTYLLKRLLLIPVTLFGITLISFLMIRLAPGDPATLKRHGMSEGAKAAADTARGTEDAIRKFNERHGLDKPVLVQYGMWVSRLARGDLGKTFFGEKDVWEEIKPHLKVTICLEIVAMLLIFLVAIPVGIYSAWRPDTVLDKLSSFVLFALYSLPSFWVATMLIIYFGNRESPFLGVWFPVSGLRDPRVVNPTTLETVIDLAHHSFLPILCLSYGTLALVSRFMRTGMLEIIRQDYIRTARAKGLPESRVILRHALRNALFPIVTLTAALLPTIVGGSIIIEVIFSIPGMGWFAYDAILRREYDILMAAFLISGVMTLAGILLSDLAYAFLDPRVSYDGGGE